MDRRSGSLNLNGIFDTCNLFGWFLPSTPVRFCACCCAMANVVAVVDVDAMVMTLLFDCDRVVCCDATEEDAGLTP